MLPYTFQIEMMGDRATLRQDLLQSIGAPIDLDALRQANPFPDVTLEAGATAAAVPASASTPDAGIGRRQPPSVPGRDG